MGGISLILPLKYKGSLLVHWNSAMLYYKTQQTKIAYRYKAMIRDCLCFIIIFNLTYKIGLQNLF